LERPGNLDSDLFPVVKKLFFEKAERNEPIRLIGVGVCDLVKNYNLDLFESFGRNADKETLFSSLDKLREMYGEDSLKYGV